MSDLHEKDTDLTLELPTEETGAEGTEKHEEVFTEEESTKRPLKKRIAVGLVIAAVFIGSIAVIAVITTGTAQTQNIKDDRTPLSQLSSNSASSRARNTSSAESKDLEGKDETDTEDASSAENPAAGSGSSNTRPSSGESSAPGAVWHPGWDEQVWVDSSGWQSVWVGDNPIIQQAEICSTCGTHSFGGIWDHINAAHGGIGGFYMGNVQIGTQPVYESRWVESGYWKSVHHEGYWG